MRLFALILLASAGACHEGSSDPMPAASAPRHQGGGGAHASDGAGAGIETRARLTGTLKGPNDTTHIDHAEAMESRERFGAVLDGSLLTLWLFDGDSALVELRIDGALASLPGDVDVDRGLTGTLTNDAGRHTATSGRVALSGCPTAANDVVGGALEGLEFGSEGAGYTLDGTFETRLVEANAPEIDCDSAEDATECADVCGTDGPCCADAPSVERCLETCASYCVVGFDVPGCRECRDGCIENASGDPCRVRWLALEACSGDHACLSEGVESACTAEFCCEERTEAFSAD